MIAGKFYCRVAVVLAVALCSPPGTAADGGAAKLNADMSNPGYEKQPDWFKISFLDINEDIQEAKEAGKHFVIYFYQDGCPYCKKLLQDNFGQHEISTFFQKHFDIVSINIFGAREVTDVDGEALDEKSFSKKQKIIFTPTLIFFSDDGKEAFRMNGYSPPHKFLATLKYVSERRYQTGEKYIDFFKKLKPTAASGKLHIPSGAITPPADLSQAASGGKPLLVTFEQRQCLACDELHLDIFRRDETRRFLDKLNLAVIDIHSNRRLTEPVEGRKTTTEAWQKDLDVNYVPTLVFFDGRDGGDVREVFRVEGYVKAFHIQSIMDYVLSKAYAGGPEFQAFLADRAAGIRARGVRLDIME